MFSHPGLARSLLAVRLSGPQFLAFVDQGRVPERQAAWGVDLLLQLATATAAEQATRRSRTSSATTTTDS